MNTIYADAYMRSLNQPEDFWSEIGSTMIHWDKPFKRVMDNTNPPFTKWFVDGYLNACYNAVDRHILAGKGDKVALIHDSPLTKTVRRVTYLEIYNTVCVEKLFIINS